MIAPTSLSPSDATTNEPLRMLVVDALVSVNDPEYPGLSIVDLGLVERVTVTDASTTSTDDTSTATTSTDARVLIELVPTFGGCPALHMIADDIRGAVTLSLRDTCPAATVDIHWLDEPAWTTDRMTPTAVSRLANEFTVTLRRKDGTLRCPVCGSDAVHDQSMAGPTRCRSVAWCPECRNPVEVFRA